MISHKKFRIRKTGCKQICDQNAERSD